MTINKFQGKTESEAIEKAKREMGPDAVIMSVKTVKPKGVFRAFKGIAYEVTAALEESEQDKANPFASMDLNNANNSNNTNGINSANSANSANNTNYSNHANNTNNTNNINHANAMQMLPQPRQPESINLAADERIRIPFGQQNYPEEQAGRGFRQPQKQPEPEAVDYTQPPQHHAHSSAIEERLDSLQSLLEDRISAEKKNHQEDGMDDTGGSSQAQEGFSFVKMLYQTLLDNEVHEKYANQILDELEKISSKGNNIDYILSHIYQKLVLKFGQPRPIEFHGSKPTVAFFIGPTGVGKTTTIAKVASRYKVDEGKKVAFLTADTYRIAATEQLRTYANILDMPLTIVYSSEEIKEAVGNLAGYDLILVDTAGFSHKNIAQCEEVRKLIDAVPEDVTTEAYLVLSATTKYRDLQDMCNIYQSFTDYKIIFTKLDETACYGNLLNIHLYSGADLAYSTNGQNVPDDIEVFNTQKIVKKLLGGD